MVKQLTDGLDPDMYSAFDSAVSLPHALKIRQQALSVQESRRRLASLGWKGTALNIGANILDPANIIVGAATGGIEWAAQGGRIARLVRGGLVAGATETALQGYLESQDPQRDIGDVLTAGMSAFVIGGSLNALIDPTRFAKAAESIQRQVELRDVMAMNRPGGKSLAEAQAAMGSASALEFTPEWRARLLNETLTEAGRTRFAPTVDEATRRGFADELIRALGMDEELDADVIKSFREADPDLLLSSYMDNLDLVDNEVGGNVSVTPTAARSTGVGDAASPNRVRVMTEIGDAFGDKSKEISPVIDAFARGWAKSTGRSVDDYYAGLRVVKGGTPGDNALYSTMAWHGTPHEFDKFDISKIGSGEGAQAYGHGLYFSSQKDIAEWYRKNLSSGQPLTFRHGEGPELSPIETLREYFKPGRIVNGYGGPDKVLEFRAGGPNGWAVKVQRVFRKSGDPIQYEQPRWHSTQPNDTELIKVLSAEGWTPKEKGRLYQVELAPDEHQMLDWDKPLSEQSAYVKERLKAIGIDADEIAAKQELELAKYADDVYEAEGAWSVKSKPGQLYATRIEALQAAQRYAEGWSAFDGTSGRFDGAQLYSDLSHQHAKEVMLGRPGAEYSVKAASPEKASSVLKEAGIPGIKYSGSTSGETNYVVFDDKNVAIKQMFQKDASGSAQGSFEVGAAGQRIIRALSSPDASTLPHEVAHDFMHMLPEMDPDLAERAAKALGADSHAAMTTVHQEAFARGFEAYLRNGEAPNAALKSAFEKFKDWLTDLYRSIVGTPLEGKMNPELKKVFDEMLSRDGSAIKPPDPISIPAQFRFDPQNASDATSSFGGARFDMAGSLGLSDSPLTRMASNLLAQDALLRRAATGEHAPAVGSASEWKRRASRILAIQYRRDVLAGEADWLKANGYTGLRAAEGKRVFRYAYGEAMRNPQARAAATPAVRQAAEAQLKLQEMPLAIAKAHGVKGADKIDPQANYLTRLWSDTEVNNVLAEIGNAGGDETWLHGYFSCAIKSAQPDIDQELANKMGKGMVQRIRRLGDDTDIDKAKMFSMDSEEAVRAVLEMEGSMTKEQVDATVRRLLPPDPEKGVGARLKSRVLLDENYEDVMPNGESLRMSRMMENDAEKLFHIYSNQMLGASAEAVVFRKVSEAAGITGDRAIETYNDFRRILKEDMRSRGVEASKISSDLSKIDTLWRHVRGIRQTGVIDPTSGAAKTMRVLRSLNNLRVAGGFGIAQAVEMGNVVGEAGMGTMLRAMPALDGIMRDAKTGLIKNELVAELEAISGIGGDRYIDQVLSRMDETGGLNRNIGRIESALHKANRFQNDISGLAGIDTVSRRIAAVAAVQRLADAAAGKTLSVKRLAELGLTPEQAANVFKHINKHVETTTGAFGRSVKRINLDKWGDQAAAAQFITAIGKWANRVVQTNDIGMMSNWMTGELGKTIMQFRNFVTGSWTKQTLHKIQMADMQAIGGAATSWLLAALVYVGETHVRAIGRHDEQNYRDIRLSTANIIAQSAARSGWSSLVPMAVDNVWGITGGDPVFQLSRYTGLSSGGGLSGTLLQNPTTALIDSGAKTIRAAGNYVRGKISGEGGGLSQSDAAAGISLLPFNRMIGVNNVLDRWKTSLPVK